MRIFISIILFCIQNVAAQEVKGIIYDADGKVSEFEIVNQTSGIHSVTNEEGFFNIKSNLGDTLVFNSIQYEKQTLIIQERHLQKTIVIELKNAINALDQVNISSSTEKFDLKKANKEFISDRERNWFLYETPNSKGNLYDDLVSIINKLFPKKPEVRIIQVSDYQELFTSDETLNSEYLKETLEIPENQYNLFFDYLESKSLNYDLLDKSRRLDLIQKINYLGEEYIIMLQSNE